MKTKYDGFEVETLESGQREDYGDRFYSYKIISALPEQEVRNFCTKNLMPSHLKSEMPNLFSGELLEFKNITNFHNGKPIPKNGLPEKYSYRVRYAHTG